MLVVLILSTIAILLSDTELVALINQLCSLSLNTNVQNACKSIFLLPHKF